ncbi:MAG TPA: TssQ family T6SS-associated lipoprotein [Burkholderiales bacterium]|jgi:Tfp pilus assembly protein PilF|nr:TssQ family T6SS-associated lipoprotein [Burkholderiales bacterium]
MGLLRTLLVAAIAAAIAGCESAPVKAVQEEFRNLFQTHKGAPDLANGIKQYEDANYSEAARLLQSGLNQGLGKSDQVKAHKYLAFIHCVSGRERHCRDEFRAALKIDPSFELAANEAGHPIWGPVFRTVKSQQ